MAGLFAQATSMVSGLLSDPARIESVVTACFGQFDKDKSGFVEGPEVTNVVNMVTSKLGVNIPQAQVDAVFAKVSGPDAKLDKAEFSALVGQLLKNHAAGGAAAAPAPAPAMP